MPPDSGALRSILPFSVSVFSISALPKSPFPPAPPFFPASGPVTGSFNGLHRESNFLAIGQLKLFSGHLAAHDFALASGKRCMLANIVYRPAFVG